MRNGAERDRSSRGSSRGVVSNRHEVATDSNRQLPGWIFHPLVLRALVVHHILPVFVAPRGAGASAPSVRDKGLSLRSRFAELAIIAISLRGDVFAEENAEGVAIFEFDALKLEIHLPDLPLSTEQR